MNTLIKIICFVIINSTLAYAQDVKLQDIVVNVSNLNSNQGKVFVAIFDSESSFLKKGIKSLQSEVNDNACSVIFKDIPESVYAISMYHDENDNDVMDKNFMGIPKEDYGCSNNAKGFMGPPKWQDAKFELNNKTNIQNIIL